MRTTERVDYVRSRTISRILLAESEDNPKPSASWGQAASGLHPAHKSPPQANAH
jgi:hypothetical protein